jgi:hypothetical protein
MPTEYFSHEDFPQGSPKWKALRAGIVTASEFGAMLAKGEGKMRRALLLRLAGERITGEPEETFTNAAMERGRQMEEQARLAYALVAGAEPKRISFARNELAGASPDALLSADGLLEVKNCKPSVLIEILEKGDFPPQHVAQVQGQMWITERAWCDLVCYWPKMPLFIKRAYRDPAYIANLRSAVIDFNRDLDAMVAKIKAYG